MEEWTAHNPNDVGFQRAGSGELYGRSPIMSTGYQSHSRARCKYMKVMQKPCQSKCFFTVSSDCKKVQHLNSTKRNYYTEVRSSKKALKIYCPSIFKGLPGTKYPAEH